MDLRQPIHRPPDSTSDLRQLHFAFGIGNQLAFRQLHVHSMEPIRVGKRHHFVASNRQVPVLISIFFNFFFFCFLYSKNPYCGWLLHWQLPPREIFPRCDYVRPDNIRHIDCIICNFYVKNRNNRLKRENDLNQKFLKSKIDFSAYKPHGAILKIQF